MTLADRIRALPETKQLILLTLMCQRDPRLAEAALAALAGILAGTAPEAAGYCSPGSCTCGAHVDAAGVVTPPEIVVGPAALITVPVVGAL